MCPDSHLFTLENPFLFSGLTTPPPISLPCLSLDLCESILFPLVSPSGLSSLPFLFLVFIPTDISRVLVLDEESNPGLLSGLSPDSVLRSRSSLGSGVWWQRLTVGLTECKKVPLTLMQFPQPESFYLPRTLSFLLFQCLPGTQRQGPQTAGDALCHME